MSPDSLPGVPDTPLRPVLSGRERVLCWAVLAGWTVWSLLLLWASA